MTAAFELRRLALWLALSASLMTAVVPAAGLVLCLHPGAAIEFAVSDAFGCPCDHGDQEPDQAPPPCDDLSVEGLDGTTPLDRVTPDDLALLTTLHVTAPVEVGALSETRLGPVILGPPRGDPPALRRLLDARRVTALLI